MKQIYYTGKLIFLLIRISINPQSTASALAVAECLKKLGLMKQEVLKVCKDSEGANVVLERKFLNEIDLTKLRQFPVGSLARVYADHMINEKLNPEFYKKLEVIDSETYAMMRLRQTHDLWHILTGFGTSVPEELGLQAFMMAQVHSPLAPFLIGGSMVVSALKNPVEALEIVNDVSKGWSLGMRAKPIFALDWESHWGDPIDKLRSEYNLSN